jgi:hypothetical protein
MTSNYHSFPSSHLKFYYTPSVNLEWNEIFSLYREHSYLGGSGLAQRETSVRKCAWQMLLAEAPT